MERNKVLGLIAGNGRLPFLIAEGARKAGLKVVCVGFIDFVDNALADEVDVFYRLSIARPGSWIRKLRKHNVTTTIMVGHVAKWKFLSPWQILHYIPDWHAIKIYYYRLRGKSIRTDVLLGAVADELADYNIYLENSTMYCKEHLADEGIMTKSKPGMKIRGDVEFGWQIAKQLGQFDIGQAVIVREKEVIAVEAIEGTANMIKRAGRFCKKNNWMLIKTSKPNQDMRFDVPCVGPETIKDMAANGGKCLVIEAGKTIIIDKPKTLALADKLGITIIGHS